MADQFASRETFEVIEEGLIEGTTINIEVIDDKSPAQSNKKWANIIRKTAEAAARVALQRRKTLTEENIAALLEVYLDREGIAEIDEEMELDNAALRASYLRKIKTYDSAQVHRNSGLNSSNTSEPASRWKRENRIFAIRYQGTDRYPVFQFEDGEPRPVIKKILRALPSDLSPWQVAFWFESGNGWLGGKSPKELLNDSSAVLQAAEQAGNPAIG